MPSSATRLRARSAAAPSPTCLPFAVAGTPVAGTPFDASASVTSSFLDSPGSKDLLITGLSLYRYDPQTLAVIGNAVAGVDLTGFGDNPVDSWSVTGLNLASGSYAAAGRRPGSWVRRGGSFGADLTVSPVPEAPFYAMLLMGLAGGALAFGPKTKAAREGGFGVRLNDAQGARRYRRKRSSRSEARRPSHSSVAPRVPHRRNSARSSRVLTLSCSST